MKVKGSYRPKNYEYEVLNNGMAIIRFYENIKKYTEKGEDGQPDVTGYEYDRYTITHQHSEHLHERVTDEPDIWLDFAKQEEIKTLAVDIRARRDALLEKTDKTQIPDADISEECREEYRTYRRLLRDIPEQPDFPYAINWPDEPVIEKRIRNR